jgi:DNA-binding transcriptional ArsR family regulator
MGNPRAIASRTQLRALVSPLRQELLDLLARTGPASAAELGRLIRRAPDGLYYHLRALERAGLVSLAGTRRCGGREEAIYRTTHAQPAVRHDAVPDGNSPQVSAIVASMLRLGIRDFRRAANAGDVRTSGSRRDLWALRITGWLTPAEVGAVNRRIRALRDAVGKPRSKGRLYGITILLTPLDHRARRRRRRPPAPGRKRSTR